MISPDSLGFYRVPGVVAMLVMVDDGGGLLDSVGSYRRVGVRTVVYCTGCTCTATLYSTVLSNSIYRVLYLLCLLYTSPSPRDA